MKCIKCGTDNNRRERAANRGKCKKCGHPFVFTTPIETPNNHKITDLRFKKILEKISSEEKKLFFTEKQLRYGLIRRLKNPYGWVNTISPLIFVLVLVTSLMPILLLAIVTMLFISIPIIVLYFALRLLGYTNENKLPLPSKSSLSSSQVREWVNRWQKVNGKIEKLLPPPDARQPFSIPKDVAAFSFDRVLVCQSDEIAQMLIANNFHIECGCAVIGFRGYPQNIFEHLLQMLRRNPKLKVYALHDASSRGLRLAHELRTDPLCFGRMSVPVFDLGIYPRQVFSMKTPFILASDLSKKHFKQLPSEVLKGLSQKEQEWLAAGNILELEFLSPKKLIQVVRHGIEMSREMEDIDEVIVFAGIPDDDETVVAFSSSFG